MLNKFIINFIAKRVAGRADDGIMITLSDPKKVQFQAAMLEDLLMRNGFNPADITSERQLKNILNQIDIIQKQSTTTSGIRNTQSAKVFDLEGQEIKNTDNIMGGKELKFDSDQPPPGSRGGADDIAAPVQSSEESLKNMMMAENKKNINKIKQRQKMLNEAIDNQSPGLTGDRKYDADIVAEDLAERMGLVYDDMPTKERLKLYDEAFQGLTKKKFDPEDMAQGGRAGFKDGMSSRSFLKIMGGLAALPIVGKFFKAGKVAAPAVEAAKETVTQTPSYFFDLVNKIKMFGKEGIPIGPRKRTVNYKNYELTEDISTGDITIVKQKGDPDFAYEEEVMLLRKGQADETTKGRTPPDEYEELTVRPDMEGKMKDVEDGIEPEGIQEIIQEASGEAPSIKKAGGGIARMLGE